MSQFNSGDRVRVARGADDVHFDEEEIVGTVTEVDSTVADFGPYIRERRILVADDGSELDQWVRPEDLTLVTGEQRLSDKDALDRIAERIQPFEGMWTDMSGILESICNTLEATGREVIWE